MKQMRKTIAAAFRRERRAPSLENKRELVRMATRMTLDQYAKTFKDLARYDRTGGAAR